MFSIALMVLNRCVGNEFPDTEELDQHALPGKEKCQGDDERRDADSRSQETGQDPDRRAGRDSQQHREDLVTADVRDQHDTPEDDRDHACPESFADSHDKGEHHHDDVRAEHAALELRFEIAVKVDRNRHTG